MPTISSVQTHTNEQTVAARNSQQDKETLDFARMLAASVQSQAQTALASLGNGADSSRTLGTDSRFAQLAFLSQPNSLVLPDFVANPWTSPRSTAQPAADTPPAATTPAAAPRAESSLGAAQINPFSLAAGKSIVSGPLPSPSVSKVENGTSLTGLGRPTDFSAFPRPVNDNGRGIHWIPTPHQTADVVDKYVNEAQSMGIKWVTLLNDGTNKGDNDYLVEQLTGAGIEPVMRLYTDGGSALEGDVQSLVRHYGSKGVRYFQLYNEPNLRIENQGQAPNPKAYAAKWLADARKVVAAGGLPGFGSLSPTPGLAPGAAPGDMDDLRFLGESLQEVVRLGGQDVLDKTWLSVHNYGDAHLRVRDYDKVVKGVLGRSLPQVGTEAGIYPGDTLSQSQATEIVADAYRYLPQREDYYFAYTYWIIANDPGQGHADGAWNHQALFRPDGNSPIVDVLKQEA
ncbi:MAG: hypothetical protein WBO46_24145 [Caldilineaceae bacterium]